MKALLTDDHSLVRDGIEMLLTIRLGFDSVYHAENGAQALACLAQDLVARVFNALIKPIALEGGATWAPKASIGVALTNGEATLQDVMNRADALMYRVKQGGKNQFIIEGEN
ncbi:diguanylate cyclase domain-containing protein [Saccharophagus degradans]|uniref:GGDEF domain-containing protein n=1 Tax=Saccharophagus degradans (strain 2-40 / ATCC 43961 / DSM 17024) TaxID=203122 RepID=Q21GW7_SACD2|nr:diguanylate cyclase [Saccharophagus degradans]ABD82062.1 hypothetical protein Sde_2805 [Saccharophagus degradans 2-40]